MGFDRALLRRARGPVVYAALCAVVLIGFRSRAFQHVNAVNGDDWLPIESFVRAHREADEPVCFLPRWTAGHATDLYKFRNIEVVASPEQAYRDRERPPGGLWVVSQFDAFEPASVPEALYPHRLSFDLGAAQVHLLRARPFEIPDNLAHHVREADCTLARGDEEVRLVWQVGRFALPRGDRMARSHPWLGCRNHGGTFGGSRQFGVLLHPPPRGQKMVMTFGEVDLLPWLVVGAAIEDRGAGRGAPVTLGVKLDGRSLATIEVPAARGWKRYAIQTGRQGSKGRISFESSTTNDNTRHLVFDAVLAAERPERTLEPGAAAGPGAARAPARELRLSAEPPSAEGPDEAADTVP